MRYIFIGEIYIQMEESIPKFETEKIFQRLEKYFLSSDETNQFLDLKKKKHILHSDEKIYVQIEQIYSRHGRTIFTDQRKYFELEEIYYPLALRWE